MKKVITTETILAVWSILNTASYKQLADEDKIRLWKIARHLKPVAKQFEEDSKDAAEKMKSGYEGFDDGLMKAKQFEEMRKAGETDGLPMTEAEYQQFIREVWNPYNSLVAKTAKEYADKEVEVDFEPLTEEAFGKLIASNDWTVDKVMTVGEILTNT